ncbi:CLUMA_CG019409, isoform A [Clunio marinus]|uniref:CLUMA_CG019409, isoform A n=1 Tax=Clunio marinus TaxID=568069 RepID=A0A1J1J377_9DIPT|nr:CLUMA_CG019409, isoform A [Clunio marinus]
MKYLIILVVAIFGVVTATDFDRPCRLAEMSPLVKRDFQVIPYLGPWYEQRRIATDQIDLDCVMARYSLNADGSVNVQNSGYTPNGMFTEVQVRGELDSPNDVPLLGKLNVFFPGRSDIYWVMASDYANYAVVWSCLELPGGRSRENSWVLARVPNASQATRTRYEEVLRNVNIDITQMRETNQNLEECRLPQA